VILSLNAYQNLETEIIRQALERFIRYQSAVIVTVRAGHPGLRGLSDYFKATAQTQDETAGALVSLGLEKNVVENPRCIGGVFCASLSQGTGLQPFQIPLAAILEVCFENPNTGDSCIFRREMVPDLPSQPPSLSSHPYRSGYNRRPPRRLVRIVSAALDYSIV
jgi:hypothetical protein